MKTGIVVCFPGTGYTCRERLFSLCAEAYEARGYETVKLDFSHIPFKEIETLEEAVAVAMRAVKRQLDGVIFKEYEDVVWISKSLGTVCAALAEKELIVFPRQLFLTPVPDTLKEIRPITNVIAMVLGTEDRFITGDALAEYCADRGYRYCLINGVGHSLKDDSDPERTERINEQIVALCD
ncbi:MAG: hypothetical protein ABFD03_04290 [Clostridiaceae bacterium]